MAETKAVPSLEALLEESTRAELPVGWTGGRAKHSGGTIIRRQFLHTKRKLRVEYDVNAPGVTLAAVRKRGDPERWAVHEILRTVDVKREPRQFEAAIRLMELANLGQF